MFDGVLCNDIARVFIIHECDVSAISVRYWRIANAYYQDYIIKPSRCARRIESTYTGCERSFHDYTKVMIIVERGEGNFARVCYENVRRE